MGRFGRDSSETPHLFVQDVVISFPKRPAVKLRFWEAEDLQGFPVKIELRTTSIHHSMEYKNVVLGPQDPTLFIYPNQCQAFKADAAVTHKQAPAGSSKK